MSAPGDFRRLLAGSGSSLAAALALSAGSGILDIVCMTALPLFLAFALSGASAPVAPPAWLAGALPSMTPASLSMTIGGIFLLRGVFALFVGSRLAVLAHDIRSRIVSRLAAVYAGASFERASTRPVAEAVTAATSHAYYFADAGVMPLLRLALDLTTILMVLAFLLFVEPRFVLGTAAALFVVAALNLTLIRKGNDRHAQQHALLEGRLAHEITVLLNAPREVRVLGLGNDLQVRILDTLGNLRSVRAWYGAAYWLPRVVGELTLIGLAIAFMFRESSRGSGATQVVSNLGVLAYAGIRLLPAFAQSLSSLTAIRSVRPVARLLAQLAGEPAPLGAPAGAPPPAGPLRELTLQGVSFRYANGARNVLQEVSLTLRAGESVGLMGPSGAGKSTLADVLMGLLAPDAGATLVDGQPADLCQPAWWQRVGFVAQSPFIANDTLARNIAFSGNRAVDPVRLARAIRMAQLEGLVAKLPLGMETPLGERGGALSGGQRQRVAIARALYRDCELLVLDEATSALDLQTEAEVVQAIHALRGKVTVLVIAHRREVLAGCDRRFELHDGRLTVMAAP